MDARKVINALKEKGISFEDGLSEQDSVCNTLLRYTQQKDDQFHPLRM